MAEATATHTCAVVTAAPHAHRTHHRGGGSGLAATYLVWQAVEVWKGICSLSPRASLSGCHG